MVPTEADGQRASSLDQHNNPGLWNYYGSGHGDQRVAESLMFSWL